MLNRDLNDDELVKEAKQHHNTVLNIDVLIEIFSLTIGSYKGAAGMILWCWVNYSFMSYDIFNQAPITYCFCGWLMLLAGYRLLVYVNSALVNGESWTLNPLEDEIVITGGSSGLGLILNAIFSANNFKCHSIDIKRPQLDSANTRYYHCDITDSESVAQCVSTINGKPSVLINCAGIVGKSLGDFADISPKTIQEVINTNTLGSMYVTHALLKHPHPVKMVVGVSSTTAIAAPAYAGVYAASKAAVRAFYESLRHELSPNTKVLCVTPGQLDTAMFKDVQTPSQFWAPIANSADVASRIYRAVLRGEQGELRMPFYGLLLPYILVLPQSAIDLMRRFVGVDVAAHQTNNATSQ